MSDTLQFVETLVMELYAGKVYLSRDDDKLKEPLIKSVIGFS